MLLSLKKEESRKKKKKKENREGGKLKGNVTNTIQNNKIKKTKRNTSAPAFQSKVKMLWGNCSEWSKVGPASLALLSLQLNNVTQS